METVSQESDVETAGMSFAVYVTSKLPDNAETVLEVGLTLFSVYAS